MSIDKVKNGYSAPNNKKDNKEVWQHLTLVLWYLWSGKTTLIDEMAKYLIEQKQNISLIVNDIGKMNVDASRLSAYEVEALTQWCICCEDFTSLVDTLKQKKQDGTKSIIIEPTWIASGEQIVNIAKEMWFTVDVISLFNTQTYANKKDDILTLTHINLADIICLTHINYEHIDSIQKHIREHNTQAPIVHLPNPFGENITKKSYAHNVIKHLLQLPKHRNEKNYTVSNFIQHAKPKPRSVLLDRNVSLESIETLIATLGNVERAKWVIAIWDIPTHFDYVAWGYLQTSGKADPTSGLYMNIITTEKLTDEQVQLLQYTCSTPSVLHSSSTTMDIPVILSQQQADSAVDTLLQQYQSYMDMYSEFTNLQGQLPTSDTAVLDRIETIQKNMGELGDAMKFDNPYIRLKYKALAYAKDTEKKVETMKDLLQHCSKKTDICYKRLDFLKKIFASKYNIDITDPTIIDQALPLELFFKGDQVQDLCANEEFMRSRLSYEHFTHGNRVAKRQNY